jgi:hypothetical protein
MLTQTIWTGSVLQCGSQGVAYIDFVIQSQSFRIEQIVGLILRSNDRAVSQGSVPVK